MPDSVTRPEREEAAIEAAARAAYELGNGDNDEDWGSAKVRTPVFYRDRLARARAALEAVGYFDLAATLATTRRERDEALRNLATTERHWEIDRNLLNAANERANALAADLATARRELEELRRNG